MKKIIIAFLLLLPLSGMIAQNNLASVFLDTPSDILFGLDKTQKEILLSDHEDSVFISDHMLYDEMRRLSISDDYISLQTSVVGNTQIKLLPLINNSNIICVVKTVCGKMCDSQIAFYTMEWEKIVQTDLFPRISADRFMRTDIDATDQNYRNAVAALDLCPLTITLSPDEDTAAVGYDIKNHLSEKDYNLLQPFLTEKTKVLIWDKAGFKERTAN